jgi:hypothetical protein
MKSAIESRGGSDYEGDRILADFAEPGRCLGVLPQAPNDGMGASNILRSLEKHEE